MNPSDSTTQPPEGEPPEVEIPGFAPPTRPTLDPLDPSTTTTTVPDPEMDPGPSVEDVDELAERREQIGPRPGSRSTRSSFDPDVASAAAGLFGLGALMAGVVLNGTLGKGSGAYLLHQEEAEAIADPLGRIAARHAPIGDANTKDVSDGIQAGVATAAYVARATTEHFSKPTTEDVQP